MWWIYITGIWTVPVFYSIKKFGSGIYVISHRSWIKLKKNSSFVRDDLQYISTKEIYQNQNHGSRLLILKYSTQQHPFAILGTKVLRLISLAQTFCLRQDLFQSTSTVHNIYRPQTKFAKVMFSQVSVCPQWGEYLGRYPPWVGTPPGRYTPWAGTTPPDRYTPWADSPPGRYTPGTDTPPAGTPRGRYTTPQTGTPPPTVHAGIRSTSGRYASHWNAFVFLFATSQQYIFCWLPIIDMRPKLSIEFSLNSIWQIEQIDLIRLNVKKRLSVEI